MHIGEMHVMFRQFAQQMGMQNVRAILPEQIDLLINTSISDTTNQLVTSSVGVTNDRIISDNSKILQINSLKSLYTVDNIKCIPSNGFSFDAARYIAGKFDIDLKSGYVKTQNGTHYRKKDKDEWVTKGTISDITSDNTIEKDNAGIPIEYKYTNSAFKDSMFLVDFSISFCKDSTIKWGASSPGSLSNTQTFITNVFPVRLIDEAFLADTLNDFIMKPCINSPVMVVIGDRAEIYFGEMKGDTSNGFNKEGLVPYELRVSYIKKPAKVALRDYIGGQNIDCDLPENLHVDIVKHAVDLYRMALNVAQPMQQQTQAQQREDDGRAQQQR